MGALGFNGGGDPEKFWSVGGGGGGAESLPIPSPTRKNPVSLIRYDKKKQLGRKSVLKLIQKYIEATTDEFKELLHTLLEQGSVNTKIISKVKE